MPVNIFAVVLYYYSFINHKIAVLHVFYQFISIDRDQFLLITTHFWREKNKLKPFYQ